MSDWRTVAGHPDYDVSSDGEVRRATPGGNATYVGKILSQSNVRGYPVVGLSLGDGRLQQIAVHRLVCAFFHGSKPTPFHQVAHGDGNRCNNRAENLRWATSKENHADRRLHGTDATGERNGRAVLNEDAVREIRRSPKHRGVCQSLAAKFGCSVGTVNIVRQRNSPVWLGVE